MHMIEETLVIAVRSVISFITLIIYTRILGKQQMSNLTYFDYINGITIGSISGTLATDMSSKGWTHFFSLTVFTAISLLFQFTTLKNRSFSKLLDCDPTVIIQQGKVLEKNMGKMRIKFDELLMMLRQKDIFDITKVQYAILEADGTLSTMLKSAHQTVTKKDMHIAQSTSHLTTDVILEGKIIPGSLEKRQKDNRWLLTQLDKQNTKIEEICFGMILPNEKLYIDKYNDDFDENNLDDYPGPF